MEVKILNVKKLFRTIWKVSKYTLFSLIIGFFVYKILKKIFLLLFSLFGSAELVLGIACVIGFIILVKVFYDLDDE